MNFYTGKRPFRGELPLAFSRDDESKNLARLIADQDEASRGRGLRYLRSFLSNMVRDPRFVGGRHLLALINNGDWAGAISESKRLLSQVYESADEQFVMSQLGSIVKKYPFPSMPEVAEENAIRKFLRGERRNRHFNAFMLRRRHAEAGVVINAHLENMRRYIVRVVGAEPAMDVVFDSARWGPGAVVGVGGRYTNFARKFLASEWTCTPRCVGHFLRAAKRFPMFWELLGFTREGVICVDPDGFDAAALARIKIVNHNSISMASKDCDCYRTIASEPLCNQWLQLGVDDCMKLLLRRCGIDLRRQEPNQRKAREGSVVGGNRYCTIDLKNASGSIYTELVRELLPQAWFDLLNDLRSTHWKYAGGAQVEYHAFASMGNGFCFPLETLIFASACWAAHAYTATNPDFRVYGDDLIVRQNEALCVLELLGSLGFEANADKTHVIGPFRESCGADWYDGQPVRPVYIDSALDSVVQRVRVHNAFIRLPNSVGQSLASFCVDWFPPFMSKLVRPFADDTDEAIDGRYWHGPVRSRYLWNKTHRCPAWYGITLTPRGDREIRGHAQYHIALMYGALSGSDSTTPFAERRETLASVARFSHWGGPSTAIPCETAEFRRSATYREHVGPYISNFAQILG